ncbi:MAG: hypothetical protein M3448_05900 [Pseudomonadota bacterium]|nr:hypothetical protein [Pseudomonadota bacterium]
MRNIVPFTIIAAAVAGCTVGPPPMAAPLDMKQQTRLAQLLGGKVAGPPMSCLPNWRTHNMTAIDDSTLIFEASPGRVFLQKPQNPCNLVSIGPYALVTRSTTGQLCRGDIAQVVDTLSGTNVGSCVMGDFIPYVRPGA